MDVSRIDHPFDAGFSLIDVLIVLALIGILSGIAVPLIGNLAESLKLGTNTREVERVLQEARLKSVTSNRPIRVRFNCPVAGEYRMVELIGSAVVPDPKDTAANRCQDTVYPYPAPDAEPLTRPNHDGPLMRLSQKVTFGTAKNLEFWPDGSVRQYDGANFVPFTTTELSLVKGNDVKKITVNGLGKVTLARE